MTKLDNERRVLTSSLLHAGRQWRRVAEQAMAAQNISEALTAPLLWISRMGGGVKQVQLAAQIGIEGPSLVRLLDQLEKLGLVSRTVDPKDRRAKNLWLTPEGESLVSKVEVILVNLRSRLLADVPRADLEATIRVLSLFETIDCHSFAAQLESPRRP
ncbi:MarR family winged helix-turn-helix transcriptional regulator [Actomonas aquatica]|uniref:MarR family transcriptional regulator n=1 Tax=Actomonas aquatica TaxID=2866162 RepID=A0ABZ1C4H4_9BACT|nr:MarR family transcriptional regulator [Opitutus sp. WL0086]WRQ86622.1 MarR family transcriptional regulator [Opitutus sp. WL0086]